MPRLIVFREEPLLRELERSFLSRQEFEVTAAGSGREMLEKAIGDGAELLVAPMRMPDMTGRQLCLQLVAGGLGAIPVLLAGPPDELGEALAAGANAFLPVPWTRRTLLSTVRGFFPVAERESGRAEVSLMVTCGEDPESYVAFTKDISPTGLFVKGRSPAQTGTRLRLRLRLPGRASEEQLDVQGEVVRRALPGEGPGVQPGMGLRFVEFPIGTRLAITRLVRERTAG